MSGTNLTPLSGAQSTIMDPTTIEVTINGTALLQETVARPLLRAQVYDPTWGDASYAAYAGKRIIPAIGSIVKDPDGTPHWVASLDKDYIPTYEDFKVSNSAINGVSFYTLDNSRFSLYVDTRNNPFPVIPDGKLIIEGVSPRYYRLVRNYSGANREVISEYRDTSGNYSSNLVPLVKLSDSLNLWYMPTCYVYPTLLVNEEILVEIIDETGLVVRTTTMYVANSEFVNDAMVYRPMIVSFTVDANQKLANGDFYLYQNQDMKNLHLTATLTYQDGRTVTVPVGKDNCYFYGETDFVSSFPGLSQDFLVRYYLGDSDAAAANLLDVATKSIFAEVNVVVVPNDLKTPVKISLVLLWNSGSNVYNPRWMMYFADGSAPVDVSQWVSVLSGSVSYSPAYFGISQSFRIAVDMANAMPSAYSTSATYQQDFVLLLRPPSATVRWLIQDGKDATNVYGADTSTRHRPRVCWDSSLKQYFIPTGLFGTSANFLDAFFYAATPIYDARIAATPPAPTHFRIRDGLTFALKTAAPIALADYGKSFNLVGDTDGNYVGGTLLVEFLSQNSNGTYSIMYGAAVDVTTGTWIGSN